MSFGATVVLYFINTMGVEQSEVRREAAPDIPLSSLLLDVAKKFGISSDQITVSSIRGETLTKDDFNKPIKDIKRIYGDRLQVVNRGDVGN